MAEPHDVGLAAGSSMKYEQNVGGYGQQQQQQQQQPQQAQQQAQQVQPGFAAGVNTQSTTYQQQLYQKQQQQQQTIAHQQQHALAQQQQHQMYIQKQSQNEAYQKQLLLQQRQMQAREQQQRLQQQKIQQQQMNQKKQEMVKKAVSDKLKQKFTFVGPTTLNKQHEGLLNIIGTLVATIFVQKGEQIASQAHLLLQNLCHPTDSQRRTTTQQFTDWFLKELPQLANKKQQIMSKLDQLLPLIRPNLKINENPQPTQPLQQPGRGYGGNVGVGGGMGGGSSKAVPMGNKPGPKASKKKVTKKKKAGRARVDSKQVDARTGLLDAEQDAMAATEVSLEDEFDNLNDEELTTQHDDEFTDETVVSEYHLEGLVKCQVARQLGKTAKIEEEVCMTIAIAAEERLRTVLESLSEICNNHVDYYSTNARIKVAKNHLADQLRFLEQFGEKKAEASAGAAASSAGAGGGAGAGGTGGAAAAGAGLPGSSSSSTGSSGMDVDGGGGKASAEKGEDDDDDDWGASITRAPKRRKVISAGDFAVWSAQNRMAGRQFKSQFRWHLGATSGGDAAGGEEGGGAAGAGSSGGGGGSAAGAAAGGGNGAGAGAGASNDGIKQEPNVAAPAAVA